MYPEFYEKLSAPVRRRPTLVTALRAADRVLVALVALAYAAVLVWLLIPGAGGGAWIPVGHIGDTMVTLPGMRFWRVLLVPAISFLIMSIARALIDEPRPYETWDIEPLIPKETRGRSFPGRHVFSAAVIACALLWLDVDWGIDCFAVMVMIGAVRVIGGVHYPRDVIAGAALGIICGVIGFWAVP